MNTSRKISPRSPVLAAIVSLVVLVAVYLLAALLSGKVVAARYPAPEQAAVWSMIGRFVSATVAVAVAAQAWRLVRRA